MRASPSLSLSCGRSALRWLMLALCASLLSACGYNDFQSKDEAVKAAWGEVINQYQRRADLIPNLVEVVRGAASSQSRRFSTHVMTRTHKPSREEEDPMAALADALPAEAVEAAVVPTSCARMPPAPSIRMTVLPPPM